MRDSPDFAVFLGRVCDAGTEEKRAEAPDAQRAAENKYKKAKQKKSSAISFRLDYDFPIYEFARNREESMSSYLKRLIREDRERSENGSQ